MSLHVALVIPTLAEIGGAERVVLELAEGLTQHRWRVTVITLSGDVPAWRRQWMTERRIAFVSLKMRKAWVDPRGWMTFLAWQRREKPDVLHGHLTHGAWFARCVSLVCGGRKPVVVDTLHSTRLGGRWTARLYRWTDELSECVTAVSDAAREAAQTSRMAARISVVKNGISLAAFCPNPPTREDAPFVWLAIGRLTAVKDYPRLLQAFANVRNRSQREARLEIAGDGELMQSLRALTDELGITDAVRWHGFCENVSELLSQADAVVLASRWEGLPLCLIEAGAAELPVVTTATAGALEVVVPDVTGRVVPLEDGEGALCKAMQEMMAMSVADRNRMGAAARGRVCEQFSQEQMVMAYADIYSLLLTSH